MELTLNFVWALLTALMVGLWLRCGARKSTRRMQLGALALLVLILFPVVSVTDDLQAAHNPAEADCCLRRDHERPNLSARLSGAPALPLPVFAGISFGPIRLTALNVCPAPFVELLTLASIQNRPPPSA